ncbi:T9SS C-terminal target domain-containing protein [Sphingobacteriales bacterium UPWRP_1]|nr:hypothetical protein BVG80_14745 [Sphingobacteriales bacterium TSM_CSM]PSJ76569.1 T9SS C-terminal target domain-containing protein [Sphingobacteriales bacterium UPWRP_1]
MKHVILCYCILFVFTSASAQQPGNFDGDFSADGVGNYYVPDYTGPCLAYAAAIQPDGKIVIAGNSSYDSNSSGNVTLMRINPDGSPDEWFGNQLFWNSTNSYFAPMGFAIENATVAGFIAKAVAILPNGNIVAGATSYANNGFVVQNFGTSGYLNSGFGNGGTTVTSLGSSATLYALAVQPDGKIVAAGDASNGIENSTFALVRYDQYGNQDADFSFDGIVTTSLGFTFGSSARALAIQPDGKIIAAGNYGGQGALVRYNADGTLDYTFGSNGKVFLNIADESNLSAVALQPDGKIVAAGYSFDLNTFQSYYTLMRLTANGSLDNSFGTNGIATVSDGSFTGVAIQPDGKIVAVGTRNSSETLDVIRFNTNGTRDNTFGIQGIAYPIFGAQGTAIALQPDGKIVVAGSALAGYPHKSFCVARYLSGFNVGMVNTLTNAVQTYIYPNPVANEAVFEFELETAATVTLSVYNSNGQIIQQPVAEIRLEAGKQKITLPVNNLHSGAYLLTLQAGQQSVTTKFVKQ